MHQNKKHANSYSLLTLVGTATTVIAACVQVPCCLLNTRVCSLGTGAIQRTLSIFSMNAKCSQIGGSGEHNVTLPPFHLVQSENFFIEKTVPRHHSG